MSTRTARSLACSIFITTALGGCPQNSPSHDTTSPPANLTEVPPANPPDDTSAAQPAPTDEPGEPQPVFQSVCPAEFRGLRIGSDCGIVFRPDFQADGPFWVQLTTLNVPVTFQDWRAPAFTSTLTALEIDKDKAHVAVHSEMLGSPGGDKYADETYDLRRTGDYTFGLVHVDSIYNGVPKSTDVRDWVIASSGAGPVTYDPVFRAAPRKALFFGDYAGLVVGPETRGDKTVDDSAMYVVLHFANDGRLDAISDASDYGDLIGLGDPARPFAQPVRFIEYDDDSIRVELLESGYKGPPSTIVTLRSDGDKIACDVTRDDHGSGKWVASGSLTHEDPGPPIAGAYTATLTGTESTTYDHYYYDNGESKHDRWTETKDRSMDVKFTYDERGRLRTTSFIAGDGSEVPYDYYYNFFQGGKYDPGVFDRVSDLWHTSDDVKFLTSHDSGGTDWQTHSWYGVQTRAPVVISRDGEHIWCKVSLEKQHRDPYSSDRTYYTRTWSPTAELQQR